MSATSGSPGQAEVDSPETTPETAPTAAPTALRARAVRFLRGVAEKMLLLSLGLAVMAVVLLLRLRGQAHDALSPVGPQLSSAGMLDALLAREEPTSGADRVLVLNGQRLHLSVAHVEGPVREALDSALADCPTRDELGGPVTTDRRGYGLCIHEPAPDDDGETPSFLDRLQTFRDTLDFADLGRLEYIYAEEREGGHTALLRLESGGTLDLDVLLPFEGDAQGADPDGIPRPPDGRRLLHSYEDGLPYFVTIYGRSSRTVEELQTWYRTHVDRQVWSEVDTAAQAEQRGIDLEGVDTLVFVRREDPMRYTLVGFEPRPETETQARGTMVTIAEAR